jgi:hypothetical protein
VGSSSSKPRKGRRARHLPKVGSPANEQWEHEAHRSVMFGSPARAVAVGAVMIVVIIGLLLLTL